MATTEDQQTGLYMAPATQLLKQLAAQEEAGNARAEEAFAATGGPCPEEKKSWEGYHASMEDKKEEKDAATLDGTSGKTKSSASLASEELWEHWFLTLHPNPGEKVSVITRGDHFEGDLPKVLVDLPEDCRAFQGGRTIEICHPYTFFLCDDGKAWVSWYRGRFIRWMGPAMADLGQIRRRVSGTDTFPTDFIGSKRERSALLEAVATVERGQL
ncbi:hypothetical protein LTS17_008541 [Exophiala oligosperma]